MSTTNTTNVQWPAQAYASEGNDLSAPIKQLLTDLRLLEDPSEDVTLVGGTPKSLQAITAGATSLSKWVGVLVAGVGGPGALLVQVQGFRAALGADTPLEGAAFLLGGSLLGVAVVLALVMIVRADVSGRATASAAQYNARAAVATALLTSFVSPPAPPVEVPGYEIKVLNGNNSWLPVERFVWIEGQLFAKVGNDDYILTEEWQDLQRIPAV
jgi:hypothetical protein